MFPIPQINPFLPEPPEIPPTVTPPQPPAPTNDPLGNAPLNELLGPPPEQSQRPQLTPIGWKALEGREGYVDMTRPGGRTHDLGSVNQIILHDRGGKFPGPGGNRPYHFEVLPNGQIIQNYELNQVGAHAAKSNKGSIGLAYAGDVGATPTRRAMDSLRFVHDKLREKFPDAKVWSHGEAYKATKGTPLQASWTGRGLEEASWRKYLENVNNSGDAQLPYGPRITDATGKPSPAAGARAASELGSPSTTVGPGGEPRHLPQWADPPPGGGGAAGGGQGGVDDQLAMTMAYDAWLLNYQKEQERQKQLQAAFSKLGENISGAMSQRPSNVSTSGMRTAANAKGLDADRFAANLKLGGGSQRPSELLAQLQRRALFA